MNLRSKTSFFLGTLQFFIILCTLLVSGIYLYHIELKTFQERSDDTLVLISAAVAESLFVVNANSAREIVDLAFSEITNIDYIKILDENNKVIVEKRRGHSLLKGAHIVSKRTIKFVGTVFGTLYLEFSLHELFDKLAEHLFILFSLGLLGLSVSSIVIWWVLTNMTRTLKNLDEGMLNLIEDTPIMVQESKTQELNNLVKTYNLLVQKFHPKE